MSKSNDSSKLGRAPQVQELCDNELQEVSGGKITLENVQITSVVATGGGTVVGGTVTAGWDVTKNKAC